MLKILQGALVLVLLDGVEEDLTANEEGGLVDRESIEGDLAMSFRGGLLGVTGCDMVVLVMRGAAREERSPALSQLEDLQ